jgi:hypothetical protein
MPLGKFVALAVQKVDDGLLCWGLIHFKFFMNKENQGFL